MQFCSSSSSVSSHGLMTRRMTCQNRNPASTRSWTTINRRFLLVSSYRTSLMQTHLWRSLLLLNRRVRLRLPGDLSRKSTCNCQSYTSNFYGQVCDLPFSNGGHACGGLKHSTKVRYQALSFSCIINTNYLSIERSQADVLQLCSKLLSSKVNFRPR